MRSVYLDHMATTPLHPLVFEAMKPFFLEEFGNPSSVHSFGRRSRAALDSHRGKIAALLTAQASDLFFMSGGTEANNFLLKGLARSMRKEGKNHIITSKAEHHSVLETCAFLARDGFEVSYLEVDGTGMVDPEDVRSAIRSKTGLISIMHANNEVGTLNPVSEIFNIARENSVCFHSDAVQAFGKIPPDEKGPQADLLSISAHKICGPKGIGGAYIRRGVGLESLLHGGGQERGRRAGTESVALAVGFAEAGALAHTDIESESERLKILKERLRQRIGDIFPSVIFNGHPDKSLPHVLNISFDPRKIEIDGEALLVNLDLEGLAVSSGSACTSGSIKPSHVLLAMGRDVKTALASVRFSMGRSTTGDDLDFAAGALEKVVGRIGSKTS